MIKLNFKGSGLEYKIWLSVAGINFGGSTVNAGQYTNRKDAIARYRQIVKSFKSNGIDFEEKIQHNLRVSLYGK